MKLYFGKLATLVLLTGSLVPTFAGGQYLAYDLGLGRAHDINSFRTVTGVSTSSGLPRAFSYSGDMMADLGALPGQDASIGYAINEFANVAGVSFSVDGSGGYPQGFRFKIDTMAEVGSLGLQSYAYDINDSGVVVGESIKDEVSFPAHAFAAVGGVMADLGTLGGMHSAASGINNDGIIVGWADKDDGITRAFCFSGGVMSDLGSLERGGSSHAADINDLGLIVGWASLGRHSRAFIAYAQGKGLTKIGTLGGANSLANAVNRDGAIVGSADTRAGVSHAFIYEDGVMTDLAPYLIPLGITGSSEALGINDLGDIVGSGEDASGQRHAFLLIAGSDPSCRPDRYERRENSRNRSPGWRKDRSGSVSDLPGNRRFK